MKEKIIQAVLEKLNADLAVTQQSAKAAHEAATGPDSKPENQYDTRGLEASYLAGAQMKRAAEIEQQIAFYHQLSINKSKHTAVQIGSLVEVQEGKRKALYLLANEAGGISVVCDEKTVNVITPKAPLGEALLGASVGETIEVDSGSTSRQYLVLSVN